MSRIGKMPIAIPQGVEVNINGQHVSVKGPKGELSLEVSEPIKVVVEENEIIVTRPDEEQTSKALHGLSRTLIANNVHGVSQGFQKNLEIVGTGYRAIAKGQA
jgi:Ribosomal protein L6P/L9E